MMKATPRFDKELEKWVIDIETEEGEIIPVGKTIDKETTLWKTSTWDTKEDAEKWIKASHNILTLADENIENGMKEYKILRRNSEMKEILIMGDITKDFNRLGVAVRQTYNGEDCGVCEVTDEEFKILCDEPNIDKTWENCGWRYCEGSNQIKPNSEILINNKIILAWYDYAEECEITKLKKYNSLLEYLCDYMGCSQPRNVCALTKDLAKYNNMKLSELFKKYQE